MPAEHAGISFLFLLIFVVGVGAGAGVGVRVDVGVVGDVVLLYIASPPANIQPAVTQADGQTKQCIAGRKENTHLEMENERTNTSEHHLNELSVSVSV